MEEDILEAKTSDEKLQVGFSYLFGWIPALIFWIQSKGKSAYVRFHTMQAILFSGVGACWSLVSLVGIIATSVFPITFFAVIVTFLPDLEGVPAFLVFIMFVLSTLGAVISPFILYAPMMLLSLVNIIAVIQGFSGRDWRYPLLAKWAEKINQRDLENSRRNVQ